MGLKARTETESDALFGTLEVPKPHVQVTGEDGSSTSSSTTIYTTYSDTTTIVLTLPYQPSSEATTSSWSTEAALTSPTTTISAIRSTLVTTFSSRTSETTSAHVVVTTAFDPIESIDAVNDDRTPSPRARKLAVGLAVPATMLLLVACILLGMYLRRRHRACNASGFSHSPRSSESHKHDFNAKPLYPHQPLATRSDSTFTTDAGPSYGSILQPGDSTIPQLPELEGLTANHSPMSEHSSDDFGTYFSGLDDPFTDAATSTREMTPGVSPSSYPLRDRLSHESERRRKAIETMKQGRRRTSISERELGELVDAFDAVEHEIQKERKVRVRSEDDVRRGAERDRKEEGPAELMASVPLS